MAASEAEIVFNPFTFSSVPGMPTTRAAMDFANLANDAASGAPGGGDDQGLLRIAACLLEEAEVGGEAVDAKEIEEIGVGEERNAGEVSGRRPYPRGKGHSIPGGR